MDWHTEAKNLIKAHIKRRGLSYEELSSRLATMGVQKTAVNINNTLNRGGFSFVFVLQLTKAMEIDKLDVTLM